MSAARLATLTKMLEALPDPEQERVIEHVREYIEDLRDERRWDDRFRASRAKLAAAARQARKEIAQGRSSPMDLEAL